VIVLRYFSDLSVADTAAALRCTTGNVKSQTARGLATLRRIMTQPVNWSAR
jgi:DNA-directed RNA polymerase specialized sigma24 family protein